MHLLNHFRLKSKFIRNVLTLMTGATIAQAIPIIISPILTRIYSPEDFGLFALYMSFASLISLAATGRYEMAIMLPEKEEDAENLVYLSILITLMISIISFILILVFNTQLANLLGNNNLSKLLFFAPITILLTGTYRSFNYWNNRKQRYKLLATGKILQSTATATSNLGCGLSALTSSGLIISSIIGQAVGTSILARKFWIKDKKNLNDIKKTNIQTLIKKYKKMPLFNLPNALIDGVRLTGINILIAKFFTTTTLGQFSLAWKMVQLPTSLISRSVSQVFYQKISTLKQDKLHSFTLKYILQSAVFSLPIFLIIYFYAENIFIFAFGDKWVAAGKIASILSSWMFLNFITAPLAHIFIVLNHQEILLKFSIIYMLVPLLILYLFNDKDFFSVLNYLSISMSITLVFFIAMVIRHTKRIQS